MHRWSAQISLGMQDKTQDANHRLEQQHGSTKNEETSRYVNQKGSHQKSDRDCAGDDCDPLEGIEKAILGMIADAEHKVSRKTAQSKKQYPPGPFVGVGILHTVE